MAKPEPGHAYFIPQLNILFGVSAIALFLTTVWMIWADYSREWKAFQRQFFQLERDTTQRQIEDAEKRVSQRDVERVTAELATATQELEAHQQAIQQLESEVAELNSKWTLGDVRERELKAVYDSEKFFFEEGAHAPLGKRVSADQLQRLEADFFGAREERRSIEFERDQKQREVRELRAKVTELTARKDSLTQEAALLRRKLDSIAVNFPNVFRNLPVVDFIDPNIEVQQVLVRNVTEDLNFAQVPRIDRCQTCHLGIDNPAYAEAEQPFRTHPNLELYVAPASLHPRDDFGCTSCHEGRGRAITFAGVNHTPKNEEQRHQWEQKYGWKEDHYWDKPMYPNGFAEAGCLKCHKDEVLLPGASSFNQSRMLYEQAGCWGCHNTTGFEDRRKVGPNLQHIASKTTEDWALRWVKDPKSFKTANYMPRFWNLENNLDSEIGARNATEVASIVSYIFSKSKPLSYGGVPGGDSANGKALLETLGCQGCHIVEETDLANVDWFRRKGPSLVGVGSKVNREFLFNWVKNPKHYWEQTFMPDLRLTDSEAGDITAFLMSSRNPEFEAIPVPQIDDAALDEITLEFLRTSLPLPQAEARISEMSRDEKKLFSGERLILRYGCFGCHDIEGFENAQKIGVDLSTWGFEDGLEARLRIRRYRAHAKCLARAEARGAEELRQRQAQESAGEAEDGLLRLQRCRGRSDLPQRAVDGARRASPRGEEELERERGLRSAGAQAHPRVQLPRMSPHRRFRRRDLSDHRRHRNEAPEPEHPGGAHPGGLALRLPEGAVHRPLLAERPHADVPLRRTTRPTRWCRASWRWMRPNPFETPAEHVRRIRRWSAPETSSWCGSSARDATSHPPPGPWRPHSSLRASASRESGSARSGSWIG